LARRFLPLPSFSHGHVSLSNWRRYAMLYRQWFVLTREFVEYALHSTLSRNLLVAMVAGEAFVPDESFFQILIVNSPFNHTVIQEGQVGQPTISLCGPCVLLLLNLFLCPGNLSFHQMGRLQLRGNTRADWVVWVAASLTTSSYVPPRNTRRAVFRVT
jgi:hypothetical protein